MEDAIGGCCYAAVAIIQATACSTKCGRGMTCCDNCCRCNCCWPDGALPVEDYPNPNSVPDRVNDPTDDNKPNQALDKGAGEHPPPAYKATPQMVMPETAAARSPQT